MNTYLRYSLLLATAVSCGGFVFGFDASVISGAIGLVAVEFGLGAWEQGMIVSAPTLGATLAALFAGRLADQIGRKRVLIITAWLYLIAGVWSCLATSFATLALARFIGGIAFASLILAPMYIAEISPAKHRGKFVSINQLNIMLGFSAAYFVNYLILDAARSGAGASFGLSSDGHAWRWMLGAEIVPSAIFLVLLYFIPESPRWLFLKGKEQQAREVLERVVDPEDRAAQMAEIQKHVAGKQQDLRNQLRTLFGPRLRKVLAIGLIVGILQQATGVNAIYFYAPTIFEQSGIGTNAAFAQAIWVGVINVVFTLISMMAIDRFGRKPLLLTGLAGVVLSMGLCGYGFATATYQLTSEKIATMAPEVDRIKLSALEAVTYGSDVEFKRALAGALGEADSQAHQAELIKAAVTMNPTLILTGILGFVASFALSLGPVMWVLLSEIFPNHMRGLAISTVGFINSGVSFLVQLVFPWELATIGSAATFLIYGGFALVGLGLVYWMVEETKGRSLEQIEDRLTLPVH